MGKWAGEGGGEMMRSLEIVGVGGGGRLRVRGGRVLRRSWDVEQEKANEELKWGSCRAMSGEWVWTKKKGCGGLHLCSLL